jgi:ABC-type uncharacterized transport system substrate-binding protein
VPKTTKIGALVNPNRPDSDAQVRDAQMAAQTIGQQLVVFRAGTERDLDNVFTTLVEQRVGALLVAADPFFANRRAQVIALSERHAIPAIYQFREFSVVGGLMSYGANLPDGQHAQLRRLLAQRMWINEASKATLAEVEIRSRR